MYMKNVIERKHKIPISFSGGGIWEQKNFIIVYIQKINYENVYTQTTCIYNF